MPAPKKAVDVWKTKHWYSVLAPKFLGEVEVARVIASDETHLLNRVITLPLREVTRDVAHIYTNISLRVHEIRGKTAFTKFIGHEVSREYLGTLVRRRRDVLHIVFPTRSRDGIEFTVKALLVSSVPCSKAQKTALYHAFVRETSARVEREDFGQFIQEVLYGKASAELFHKLKKIAPLKRIEFKKTTLKEEFDVEKTEPQPLPSLTPNSVATKPSEETRGG